MNILNKALAFLSNVQILSALIWAAVILGCACFSDDPKIINILITGAGMQVVLMSSRSNKRKREKMSVQIDEKSPC